MVAYKIKNASNTKHSRNIYDHDDFFYYFQNNNGGPQNEAPQKELKLKKVGSLDDRSELSDEMADLCKKLPIYRVVEADFADGIPDGQGKRLPAKRKYHFS